MSTDTVCAPVEFDQGIDRRVFGVAHDLQYLMRLLRSRAKYISRTLAWEHVAMGVAEINELARCSADLARELQQGPTHPVEAIDVGRSIMQMQTLLRTVAGVDTAIRYEVPACDSRVQISGPALEQMLINLVANARHAGAKNVLISLHCETRVDNPVGQSIRDGFLSIEVVDNGCGVAEAMLREAAENFGSDEEPDWFGIGLGTIMAIARSVGGSLRLSTHGEGGLAAEIRLPATPMEQSSIDSRADTAPSEKPQRGTSQGSRDAVLHAEFVKSAT